jgi:hypothetical protein
MPTGTVTVTQNGSTAAGTDAFLTVITGQNAAPIGISQSAASAVPSLATGAGVTTGSLVFGACLGATGTFTPNAATTTDQDHPGQGLEYLSFRSTAVMVGGVSAALGYTGGTGISICLLEILKGAGVLARDASTPAAMTSTGLTVTSASFGPPSGSLLVLAVQANGNVVNTVAITDTLGGLVWTERIRQNPSGSGYSGLWTAPVPTSVASTGLLLGMEG